MIKQKYLSNSAMVGMITFVNMFIPLSTDLYLPALPQMGRYFQASEFLVGMTLTIFFFIFAVSMVLFGPMTDKYGRKRVMAFGATIYTIASVICALSPNIYILLIGRFFQAVGSGAVITVATALIKDCFEGKIMSKILAITQALGVIAPMTAPLIGGFLLIITSWRGAFFLLTFLGAINILLSFLLTETLTEDERYKGKILDSLKLLLEVGKQKNFMMILIMFSILAAPYMAYLSVSSFVYIEYFILSAQQYSYFFAVNSAAAVLGPILYLKLKIFMSNKRLTELCFIITALSGFLVMFPGNWSALAFLLSFLPFTIIESVARPFAMDILLNQAKENVGTAAAMINFVPTLFGSLGMALGTLPWGNFIDGLGIIILSSMAISMIFFFFVKKI